MSAQSIAQSNSEWRTAPSAGAISHSLLGSDDSTYKLWRDVKLANYVTDPEACVVEIKDPAKLTASELERLGSVIRRNNFAIYQYLQPEYGEAEGYRSICRQLGLTSSVSNPESDDDDITTIKNHAHADSNSEHRSRYIPYTNHALNWHTDGYYNTAARTVRSFVLHCLKSASSGGTNQLLDHEIAYILLRDKNPEWAEALCDPDCFTIPANVYRGKVVRDSFTGPVFSTDPITGELYARYTERKYNVIWKTDPAIQQGTAALRSLLCDDQRWVLNITLEPGQGLICNNVLHNRNAFEDDIEQARCLQRIRFSQRICISRD